MWHPGCGTERALISDAKGYALFYLSKTKNTSLEDVEHLQKVCLQFEDAYQIELTKRFDDDVAYDCVTVEVAAERLDEIAIDWIKARKLEEELGFERLETDS